MAFEATVLYLPYIRIVDQPTVGPWTLVPLKNLRRWPSREYGRVARSYLRKHRDPGGLRIDDMTVICRDGLPYHEAEPAASEVRALQAALQLAVLNMNPPWPGEEWRVRTADNLDVFGYRLSEDTSTFTTERGSVVRVLSGGNVLSSPHTAILSPLEVYNCSITTRIEEDIAGVAYGALADPDNADADRLRTAIHWLSFAWRNSPSVSWPVRAVAVQSGLEVLLQSRGAWSQAKRLRRRFEQLGPAFNGLEVDDFLWATDEVESELVMVDKKPKRATPLQAWYMGLSKHRNDTLHDTGLRHGPVHESGNAYDGPFVWVGQRVLRDLIRCELSLQTGEPMFMGEFGRIAWAVARELGADAEG